MTPQQITRNNKALIHEQVSMKKSYSVYIMSNRYHTVLYTGITSDLRGRVWEHQTRAVKSFTSRYNVYKLLYYEDYDEPKQAIEREKQIKGYRRSKKVDLIMSFNPGWIDLASKLWPDGAR